MWLPTGLRPGEHLHLEFLQQGLGLVPVFLRPFERPEVPLRLGQISPHHKWRRDSAVRIDRSCARGCHVPSSSPHLPLGEPDVDPSEFGRAGPGAKTLVQRAEVVRRGMLALAQGGVQLADPEGNIAALARFGSEERALVALNRIRHSAARTQNRARSTQRSRTRTPKHARQLGLCLGSARKKEKKKRKKKKNGGADGGGRTVLASRCTSRARSTFSHRKGATPSRAGSS